MNDLNLLDFVCLALKDPHVSDRASLVEIACQYGKRYEVSKEEVEKMLDKRLIDFL